MDGVTTVIVSVIFSATITVLAALVTCVLLARFDVNGRMATAKNGGQQSKAVGQKRERYILYIPRKGYFCFIEEDNRPTFALSRRDGMIEHFESMKEAMLIVNRLKAKRYQILDVKGNVVKSRTFCFMGRIYNRKYSRRCALL